MKELDMKKVETNKAVLVTGASRGIGRQVALDLKEKGYFILLQGRDEKELIKLESELGQKDSVFLADFSRSESGFELAQKVSLFIQSQGFYLVGLVNNAGYFERALLKNSNLDLWKNLFEVNFFSVVNLTQSLFEELKKSQKASIVNISSSLALKPSMGTGAYGAAKAALVYWSQNLALEWGAMGIRANVICPGIIQTPLHPFYHLPESEKEHKINQLNQLQPLGRIGQPRDISAWISFLISDSSEWTTGAVITVDGGINLK